MPIDTKQFLAVLRAILSESAVIRARACDEATDWVDGWSGRQAGAVVSVSLWLAEGESDFDALEAELHAASELVENCEVDRRDIQGVRAIDRNRLPESMIEYYDYLVSMLDGDEKPS
ncbi:hypothetical protein ACIBCN_30575 [Nocardia sp. NPDC051052]|uniref:hypothetical protein n=1 Tax=Nocardia sp. NPDC051052 TaxID=3364322 RepID=UPI0037A09458